MNYRFYDIHSHFLPGIDDGCQSVRESVAFLREQIAQGCMGIVATPHYYAKESIETFCSRRQEAYMSLKQALMSTSMVDFIPKIGLAAEVYYYKGIATDNDINRLCYGTSNYLLLEMPFAEWNPSVLREIKVLQSSRGIIPVIAHIERFFDFNKTETIEQLINIGVIVQVNSGTFLRSGNTKKLATSLLKHGTMQAMGSDAHNMESRVPNIKPAIQEIVSLGYEHQLRKILKTNEEIFNASIADEHFARGVAAQDDFLNFGF